MHVDVDLKSRRESSESGRAIFLAFSHRGSKRMFTGGLTSIAFSTVVNEMWGNRLETVNLEILESKPSLISILNRFSHKASTGFPEQIG